MGAEPKAGRPKKQATQAKVSKKAQKTRFIEAARKIGVDESGGEFERLFRKVAPPKNTKARTP
jgi:hypothetical protein